MNTNAPLKREIELRAGEETNRDGLCWFIYYKDVPLVNNGYYKTLKTKGYLVFDEEANYYFILLETPNCYESVDLHTYGEWETLAEAEAWLENPTPLY